MELEEHLFRHEAGRMVATLTRIFGIQNLTLAEDVVQDAFCRAIEVWKFGSVPENPSAWLMAVARNRALDILRRERRARTCEPELSRFLGSEWTLASAVEERFSETAIRNDQLRMMFSCCHPRLSEEAQVMLILHILCGFSVDEVARAFVTTHTGAAKRISRAKKVLAASKRLFDTQVSPDFSARLPAVERALYLLFNQGYHGPSAESPVRAGLCRESIRLARLLLEQPHGATPATHALLALMCLNAARLPARVDAWSGDLTPLREQDRSKWDQKLAAEGIRFLELAASGPDATDYHVEAAIASVHATAGRFEDTDWDQIVSLYDMLMAMHPSPIVALNRAIAIAERNGPERGLEEIHAIPERDRMRSYPFYEAALGELELRCGRHEAACEHFDAAVDAARNQMERRFLRQRLNASKRSG